VRLARIALFKVVLLIWAVAAQPADGDGHWYCQSSGDGTTTIRWVDTDLGRQKVVEVTSGSDAAKRTLVVFLHGDSPFGDPTYQYEIVRSIAQRLPGAIAVTLLRPGYADDCGDQSGGDVGYRMGDNYTADVVSSLAATIRDIVREHRPQETVVIGHSGGAALAALLASSEPDIQDRTVLVACPCDIPAWRQSMAELTGNERWLTSMAGLSPMTYVDQLDPTTPIDLWVGSADVVTPPFLSETFADEARRARKVISYQLIEGGDHDMILQTDVLDAILSSFIH